MKPYFEGVNENIAYIQERSNFGDTEASKILFLSYLL
jgi:hypothetical protein